MSASRSDLIRSNHSGKSRQTFGSALTDGRALKWLTILAIIFGTIRRLGLGLTDPLGIAETWTGAIATAPDLSTLLNRCLAEMTGPMFYGLIWGWAKLSGVSDVALRIPAAVATVAMPLLILWRGHPDRTVRLLWAGLAAVWISGTMFAGQARPYGLLTLYGTIQVTVLVTLLRSPRLATAFAWTAASMIAVMTHYQMLPITVLQGLVILSRGRAAWRCWPALAALIPLPIWMAWHLPALVGYATPGSNWYLPMGPAELALIAPLAMGFGSFGSLLFAALVLTSLWRASPGGPRIDFNRWDVRIALTGVAAIFIVLAMALIQPSFSPRYLLPPMPAILFGLALWGAGWGRRWSWLPVALLGTFLLLAFAELRVRLQQPPSRGQGDGFEIASEFLATARPKRLVAYFDGTGSLRTDRALLGEVGGFFLRRAGHQITVIAPAFADPRTDPNRALPAIANRPGDAILWIYDVGRPGVHGTNFPARIGRVDERFRCRDYGSGFLAVIACIQSSDSL